MKSILPAVQTTARDRARAIAIAMAALAIAGVHAAPNTPSSVANVAQGKALVTQLGNSMLVVTSNAPGTKQSVINWNTFNVPQGSITTFQQPSVDSTSINRVTGGKLSDIQGTLTSNGNLVLVNPAGIALGKNAIVDTAGFTASTMQMSDADALSGRLRFSAGKDDKQMKIEGRIVARAGDIVLVGSDIQVSGDDGPKGQLPTLQASGSIILAAGSQVEVTGRGLEGIVMQLDPKGKIEIKKDSLLEADAVGLFASQLKHSGVIEARRVVLQDDKVRLDSGSDDDSSGKGNGNGNSDGNGNGNGNSGKGNGNGNGSSGNTTADSGSATDTGTTPVTDTTVSSAIDGGGSVVLTPSTTIGSSSTTTTTSTTGASAAADASLQAALSAPLTQTVALSSAVLTTYTAPAVTPAQALADDANQQRYAAAPEKSQDKTASATTDAAAGP